MQKIYDALKTLWGVTEIEPETPVTPDPDPEEPETGEHTVLSTTQYTAWSTGTPLADGYNLPFTPKVDMTLKGLKFKVQSEAAATLRVVIYDTVDKKELEEVTAEIVQNTDDGNEVNATLNSTLVADRFYKIYIGTKDSSKVLHYPYFTDERIAENAYFSVTRESEDDYFWKNTHMRYGGYVTFTTA